MSRRGVVTPEEERPVVLVVDDEADIRTVLAAVFDEAGFDVVAVADGREAIRATFEHRPDLVVLDLGLPDLDGMDVLRRIREMSDVPVLVLTARDSEIDKVTGFSHGADDYLTKPFSNAEIVARAHALLRRRRSVTEEARLVDGGLVVDLMAKSVHLDGEPVALSRIDWNLLVAFLRHRGQVLSPDQLLEQAWGDPFGGGDGRVKFAIRRLRRRLGWDDPATSPIETVRGFGYRYRGVADTKG
jgi:DNA-binding response OmpR family regulator